MADSDRNSSPPPRSQGRSGELIEHFGYWVAFATIYFLQLSIWFYTGLAKFTQNNLDLPPIVAQQFNDSFISRFPGTHTSWIIIAILESIVFFVLVASVLIGEFLPWRRKNLLLGSLIFSLGILSLLIFGNFMTNGHALYTEELVLFAVNVLLIFLIRFMPPYHSMRWLSDSRRNSEESS